MSLTCHTYIEGKVIEVGSENSLHTQSCASQKLNVMNPSILASVAGHSLALPASIAPETKCFNCVRGPGGGNVAYYTVPSSKSDA